MWEKKAKKTYSGIKKEDIWNIWQDINNWPLWNKDIESARLLDAFQTGGNFEIKPKGAPLVKLTLEEVVENKSFTDCLHLPGAKMYGNHQMEEKENGDIELSCSVTIKGINSAMWILILGEKIAAKMEKQMDDLVLLTIK
jgi:hypothetical protein